MTIAVANLSNIVQRIETYREDTNSKFAANSFDEYSRKYYVGHKRQLASAPDL